MFKYFLLWLPMPFIAILNAIIRELLFVKNLGESTAHQISTATLLLFLGFYIFIVLNKWRLVSTNQAVLTGVLWSFLTILFEFSIGFASNKNFSELIQAYNLLSGNLWALVPLFMLVSPVLYFSAKNK
jgi:glucose uptake protein GlcU